jgi:hypothetical protein
MSSTPLSRIKNERLIFSGLFIAGFALCTRGIARAPVYGWTHPASLAGILLGGLSLLLGAQVILRLRLLPALSDRQAIFGLLAIIAIKFLLAGLYR